MTAPALTESTVYGLLRDTHRGNGNGGSGRAAVLASVRNNAGFGATRTFDAVAMDLWPSRGLTLHIYEIKVSRSDWQRELANPAKAEDACRLADRFSIIAPKGCVKPGELPPTWGLIEVHGDGTEDKPWRLRTKTSAPLLHDETARPLPRGLVVGMLRSCPSAIPGHSAGYHDAELAEARRAGYEAGKREAEQSADYAVRRARDSAADVAALEAALEAAGVPSWDATPAALAKHAGTIAAALTGAETGRKVDALRSSLRAALTALEGA